MIIKKGLLKSFYSGSYTATVQAAGSGKAYLEGIQVARNISAGEMVPGRTVAVLFWDRTNPKDGAVIGVY